MQTAVVGGVSEITQFATAAPELKDGKHPTYPAFGAFKGWQSLRDHAYSDFGGGDLQRLVRLVDRYGTDFIVTVARNCCSEKTADRLISTAHKAKGREGRECGPVSTSNSPSMSTATRSTATARKRCSLM